MTRSAQGRAQPPLGAVVVGFDEEHRETVGGARRRHTESGPGKDGASPYPEQRGHCAGPVACSVGRSGRTNVRTRFASVVGWSSGTSV